MRQSFTGLGKCRKTQGISTGLRALILIWDSKKLGTSPEGSSPAAAADGYNGAGSPVGGGKGQIPVLSPAV